MKSLKTYLISLACGLSFILGTDIIIIGGAPYLLGGCVMYFIGYWLMDKYRERSK